MDLISVIQSILGFGLDIIAILFKMMFAFFSGFIALLKGRNFFLWGMGTLIFPWLFFIVLFIPRTYPRFQSYMVNKEEFRGKNPVIASIMALSAIVAKSDGNVTKEEISVIKRFISSNFRISYEELNSYGHVFDYGKNHPNEYSEYTRILNTFYKRKDQMIAIAYLFVSIAMQDGQISEEEDMRIRSILFQLGVSEYEYSSIKNAFTSGRTYYENQTGQGYRESSESLIKKYSRVLEVDEDASMSDIKKAYRTLVKEYHPDKIANGMPEDYKEFANKKIIEINEAYDYLKKVKEA